MPSIDADGRQIKTGDLVVSATLPDRRLYKVLAVGRLGSRNDGRIRTATSHWEYGHKWRVVPADQQDRSGPWPKLKG